MAKEMLKPRAFGLVPEEPEETGLSEHAPFGAPTAELLDVGGEWGHCCRTHWGSCPAGGHTFINPLLSLRAFLCQVRL